MQCPLTHNTDNRYEFGLRWGVDIVTPAWCHDTAAAGGRVDERWYKLPLDISGKLSPMESELVVPELAEDNVYMDGCRIHLVGFVGDRERLYVKIVRAGGATIPRAMDDRVTHVVVVTPPEEEQLVTWRRGAHVVHAEWLLACCQQGKLVDHTRFELLPQESGPAPVSPSILPPSHVPRPTATSSLAAGVISDGRARPATPVLAANLDFMSMFQGQWGVGAEATSSPQDSGPGQSLSNGGRSQPLGASAESQQPSKFAGGGGGGRDSVFDGLTFAINATGFDTTQRDNLHAVLTRCGGVLASGITRPAAGKGGIASSTYTVCPLVGVAETLETAGNCVTECWVERCVSEGQLVSPDACLMFRPLKARGSVYALSVSRLRLPFSHRFHFHTPHHPSHAMPSHVPPNITLSCLVCTHLQP